MFKLTIRSTNPYASSKPLFTRKEFKFEPGINVLTGCNGSGKSTLIKSIRDYLRESENNYIYFDRVDECRDLKERCFRSGKPEFMFRAMCSSEGEYNTLAFEVILYQINQYVNSIGDCIENKFILIDAFDSGLSIDMIRDIMALIKDAFIPEANACFKKANHPENNLYIIIAANNFETVRNQRCIDARTAAIKQFTSYEEYEKYVFETRKRKDRRIGGNNNSEAEEN